MTWAMKEALARIRHSKSNRPVFTSEFLARIKRIIVFRSLDEQGMLGIAQRMYRDMKREWSVKREKTLLVTEPVIEAIGKKAFQMDEKAQGREGGRIVRKLFANIVEASIQSAIMRTPDVYRAAGEIAVDFCPDRTPAAADLSPELIDVRFTAPDHAADRVSG
jgi:ATP-dependent Clp protease ATP-binding subunit ClpA